MKNFVLIYLVLIGFSNCGSEKNVWISGNISESNAENIFLHELANENLSRVDSVRINAHGHFTFKRKISQPTFFSLTVNAQTITLLAHPREKIVISGSALNLPQTYNVEGSEDSRHIRQLSQRMEKTVFLRDSLINVLQTFENNRNFLNIQRQFDWIYSNELDSLRLYNIRFIENNPQSLVVIYSLYQQIEPNIFLFNQEEDIRLFLRADSLFYRRFPKVAYVNMLRADAVQMSELNKRLRLNRMLHMLGEEAPEIALPTPDGKIVKLSSTRGNFVLVDFWASWSAESRAENIKLLDVYNKFKHRGFEVYQVSLDRSKAAWERAIKEDGLSWINVSDNMYWDSEVVSQYGVETIPSNFLLDREGSIMTKNMSAETLDRRLSEFFAAIE